MILLVGQFENIPAGIAVERIPVKDAKSLTALVLEDRERTPLLICAGDRLPWSDGHVLSAAKIAGRCIVVGSGRKLEQLAKNSLIEVVQSEEEAWKRIAPSSAAGAVTGTTGSGTGTGGGATGGSGDTEKKQLKRIAAPEKRVLQPYTIPQGQVLIVDVIGSQDRIGCTTQALMLWHYFHALGVDVALVPTDRQWKQFEEMRSVMASREEPDGTLYLGEVPVVQNCRGSYDCYIRDLGKDGLSSDDADLTVLVAGSKPWELMDTIACSLRLRGQSVVVLSFTTPNQKKEIEQLFNDFPIALPGYLPDPWKADIGTLLQYDELLREPLQRILTPEQENEYEVI